MSLSLYVFFLSLQYKQIRHKTQKKNKNMSCECSRLISRKGNLTEWQIYLSRVLITHIIERFGAPTVSFLMSKKSPTDKTQLFASLAKMQLHFKASWLKLTLPKNSLARRCLRYKTSTHVSKYLGQLLIAE